MNNPNPPRAPELQAALDWSKSGENRSIASYNNISKVLRPLKVWSSLSIDSVVDAILAAEVYRLEEQVRTLRTALASAELWHSGDKWRFSKDPKERECWERRNTEIKAALAQPSETKETK